MRKNLRIKILSLFVIVFTVSMFGFAARFSLHTDDQQLFINCPYVIDIKINTEGQLVTAADMILEYDPQNIEIIGFEPGDFFALNRGLQRFENRISSTAINYTEAISGIGNFGKLTVISKKIGKPKIYFYVEKIGADQTRDTNIAYKGKDYLTNINNLNTEVTTGSCGVENINSSDFKEYDNKMSYEEFDSKRQKEINKSNKQSIIRSIADLVFIVLVILLIIVIIQRRE